MLCYTCDKYENCNHPRKCSDTIQGCTGYHKEQTNEEWLNSLDTEEKANVLYKMINDGLCGLCKWDCRERCFVHTEEDELKVICDWLKEVHKE